MPELHVLRVFCGEGGGGGNPLGVFLDGSEVPAERSAGDRRRARIQRDGVRRRRRARRDAHLHPGGGAAVRRASRGGNGLAPGPRARRGGRAAPAGRRGSGARRRRADLRRRPPGVGAGVRVRAGRIRRPMWRRSKGLPRAATRSGFGRGSTRPRASIRERVFAPRYGIAEDEATGSAAITLVGPAAARARHPPGRRLADPRPAARRRDGGDRRPRGAGRRAGVRASNGSGGAGNRTQTSRLKVCSPTFGPRPRNGDCRRNRGPAMRLEDSARAPRLPWAAMARRKLTEYEKKRSFEKTPEPRGGKKAKRGQGQPLRGPRAPRAAAALGPAAGARRRARLLGAAEGGAAGPEGEPARRPHRGPSRSSTSSSRARSRRASTAPGRSRSGTAAPTRPRSSATTR